MRSGLKGFQVRREEVGSKAKQRSEEEQERQVGGKHEVWRGGRETETQTKEKGQQEGRVKRKICS